MRLIANVRLKAPNNPILRYILWSPLLLQECYRIWHFQGHYVLFLSLVAFEVPCSVSFHSHMLPLSVHRQPLFVSFSIVVWANLSEYFTSAESRVPSPSFLCCWNIHLPLYKWSIDCFLCYHETVTIRWQSLCFYVKSCICLTGRPPTAIPL